MHLSFMEIGMDHLLNIVHSEEIKIIRCLSKLYFLFIIIEHCILKFNLYLQEWYGLHRM